MKLERHKDSNFLKQRHKDFKKTLKKKKKILFSFSIYLKIVTNFIYESIIQFFFK